MNLPKPALVVALSLVVLGTACKKEHVNKLPVAEAGPSQIITPPVEFVMLSGSGTDADGKIITYSWKQLSGPTASVIVDPDSPSTMIEGIIPGTYIYQLSVFDDKGGVGRDTTSVTLNAQQGAHTLTLQPDNNPNEVDLGIYADTDVSALTQQSLEATSWTIQLIPIRLRGLVKFDLSSIPSSSTIVSARLYLYSNPAPTTGNFIDANFGFDNSFTIRQVSSDWNPATVSWMAPPDVLTNNQVYVPSTPQSQLDLNIDVTGQVSSMVKSNANYGFMLQLVNEATYTCRIFVASHNASYPEKHPKLVVSYN